MLGSKSKRASLRPFLCLDFTSTVPPRAACWVLIIFDDAVMMEDHSPCLPYLIFPISLSRTSIRIYKANIVKQKIMRSNYTVAWKCITGLLLFIENRLY